jgi:glucosylceramidase
MHVVTAFVLLLLIADAELTNAQTVSVWLTTDNQSTKLQQQSSVMFAPGTGGDNPVFVDETQTYQQVEGFGASFTDSAAYLLNQVATPTARSNAMSNLFTRTGGGIGVSFVRNPMGASDLARWHYSYDDLPPGQTDSNLTSFSIAHDQTDIIPLVQQALQLNPQLKIMANPWSPPGWMKDSGSMIGGSLLPSMYTPFAKYFVKYVQAYQAAGIPIHYISLQNEPLYVPGNYPGMSMDATTQRTVLRDYVLPTLASNSITAKVLVYDHNWDRPDYPETIFSDGDLLASSQVAGTAWHGYGGTPGMMLALANEFPTKGNYQTEHSGGTWIGDPVRSDFEEIIHVMRSWGRAYVKWSLALDQNRGPNTGGCDTCDPIVTINSNTGALSYDIEFYTLGHFSKFVLPGAYRIYSGNGAGVVSAAFLNPDGSKVLVAFNDTTSSKTFQVQWGSQSFSYTLASFAGATFDWTGTQSGGYTVNPANQIQASSFNAISGLVTEPTTDTLGGYNLGYSDNNDYAVYKNVNFATGITNVFARVASYGGGTLEFRLDSPTGSRISTLTFPNTGGWQDWQIASGSVTGASGLHDLYVIFKGSSGIGNLNWFQFGGAFPPAAPGGLMTTPGNAQVALAWDASPGATSYNVKRATISGGPYTTIAGPATNIYTDNGVTNCVTYYYVVSATNALGESANSGEASATPGLSVIAVNSGGSTAGQFITDANFSGGSSASTNSVISISGLTNPAPQAVYQTERYGTASYTFGSLTPGTSYTVRLHFAEFYWTITGQRRFNVSINGTQVLTNFDIIAVAGGQNKGTIREFTATADGSGQIVIVYTTVTDNAKSSGIEILALPPATPLGLTATAGNAQVALSWGASAGATGYNVKRATTSGGPYTTVTNGLTSITYTNTGLVNGTTYYYVVSALKTLCESPNSTEASATLPTPFAFWQLQYFGCTNCPQADAAADPDGDGQNNLAESTGGTNPTDSASFFHITSITTEDNDIRVTWMMGSGKTNALQAVSGDPAGSYPTNYADIFTVTNTVGSATNHLDAGAATNPTGRYYRVRVVP